MIKPTVSVIGLGKLGLPLAVCLAQSGYQVIGVDNDPRVVAAVEDGAAHIYEPGLQELLAIHRDAIRVVGQVGPAVRDSDVTFIVVPTPSEENGGFSSAYVESAAVSIGEALRPKESFHVVSLVSTVMPGTTAGTLIPALQNSSGKVAGRDFGVCYNPEFIALGSVIHDLQNADMVLIGESDSRSGDLLEGIYRDVCLMEAPVNRMSIANAEVTKIAINTFITTKISFANMLAELCERIPGGNVDVVTHAVGTDSRIGEKYLKGGMSYGGPCFPRDNKALSRFATLVGTQAPLAEVTDSVNRSQTERMTSIVRKKLGDLSGKTIAILGLTYKPNTNIVEESGSVNLAASLLDAGAEVSLYDPSGVRPLEGSGVGSVRYASSAGDCIQGTDLCVLATPWPEFERLTATDFRTMKRQLVLDCWRLLPGLNGFEDIEYLAIGHEPQIAGRD